MKEFWDVYSKKALIIHMKCEVGTTKDEALAKAKRLYGSIFGEANLSVIKPK